MNRKLTAAAVIAAALAQGCGSTDKAQTPTCERPEQARWSARPDGCATLMPGQRITLPVGTTEVDVPGYVQRPLPSPTQCPQWAFTNTVEYGAIGWTTCQRKVEAMQTHKPIRVFWWAG
jgi:hypothetical protein